MKWERTAQEQPPLWEVLVGASMGGLAMMWSAAATTARGCVFVDITPKMEFRGVKNILQVRASGRSKGAVG